VTTATAPAPHLGATALHGARLSFPRLVRSEWIKMRSIRSTVWCFAILFLLNIGFPALIASVGHFTAPHGPALTGDAAGHTAVEVVTLGVNFTSLVVAVLGVLIVTGEYSTGMIRGTFTADPGRLGALFAKALVLAVATFVVSAVSTLIALLLAHPILANNSVHFDLGDPKVLMPVIGASVYVTLLALLAFGIGTLVRTTAGGIAITLGVLLVAPIILQIVGGLLNADWPANVNQLLPSSAGGQLFAYEASQSGVVHAGDDSGHWVLNGWGGFGVLAAEVVAVGIAALALVKRRDA
jgi:ABC-2 type transport system permease protein